MERRTDILVYHLYGLSYDEALIVDPEQPFTREEYESLAIRHQSGTVEYMPRNDK